MGAIWKGLAVLLACAASAALGGAIVLRYSPPMKPAATEAASESAPPHWTAQPYRGIEPVALEPSPADAHAQKIAMLMKGEPPGSVVFGDLIIGCRTKHDLAAAFAVIKQNDTVALVKMIDGHGYCTAFKAGNEAFLVDADVEIGIVKVRSKGEVDGHWVPLWAVHSPGAAPSERGTPVSPDRAPDGAGRSQTAENGAR